MGLARIAIAVLAVVLAVGLVIVGGVALWGALTKDSPTPQNSPSTGGAPSQATSGHESASARRSAAKALEIRCLAPQCKVYVAGPGPTDVQFSGLLGQNERKVFDELRLTLVVDDASAVSVIINGKQQPKGRPGERRTYQIPQSGGG